MITAHGWIAEPKKIIVKIQIELPIVDLIKIRDQLKEPGLEYWPFGKLAAALTEIADQVEETAYTNIYDEAPK